MTLKGNYSGDVSYSVGDVVKYAGIIYILQKPCAAGTIPTNSLYWERMQQYLCDAVDLMIDAVSLGENFAVADVMDKVANNLSTTGSGKILDARQGKALKDLINGVENQLDLFYPDSKTLRLQSSTASSVKKFDITVDDTGELSVTEYTPPET